MLKLGELMEYGIITPCCIDNCRMRENNYVVIANEYYGLCDFHYAEYMMLHAHAKQAAQEAIDTANELMNQQMLSTLIGE